MKNIILILFSIIVFHLFAEQINFSECLYNTEDFLEGLNIEHPQEVMLIDSLIVYPTDEVISSKLISNDHDYYFIIFHSPYICGECYGANYELLKEFANDYPKQVFLLIENWNNRETKIEIETLDLGNNIQIILDDEGKSIRKLSELDSEFINAGFVVINRNKQICFIQMASFSQPYKTSIISRLLKKVEEYLNSNIDDD